jgi:large subunit ribosomal protein L9
VKLILTQEVSGLGAPGDVVEVKDGYGRNFLLPRGLAVAWTRGGEKQVATIRKARASRAIHSLEDAQQVKAALEASPIRLPARAGASGRLFGAITPADVAEAVRAVGGQSVDRRKVELPQVIKTVGDYTVHVRLHPDVRADLRIEVVAAS